MTLKKAFAPIGKFIAAGSRSVAKLKEMTLSQLSGATMSMKKLFAPFKGVIVAGAVPAAKLRFAPQRVNHSQNPQIKEVIMSIIKKLVASFVGLNLAGPRSAMKLLSVLLAFILGATLWVGPTAAAEKKYVTDPTTGKVVSAPEYGGTITQARAYDADFRPDPYIGGPVSLIITSGVNEKLALVDWAIDRDIYPFMGVYVAPVYALRGALAESWEQPDDTTYIFHIRKGVHWHDKPPVNGRELTAKDVEHSFHRMLGNKLTGTQFSEAEPSPAATVLVALPWESVTATDKYTVVMKLKELRLAALNFILDYAGMVIQPPEVIEEYGDMKDWRNVVGTGPFELTPFRAPL